MDDCCYLNLPFFVVSSSCRHVVTVLAPLEDYPAFALLAQLADDFAQ